MMSPKTKKILMIGGGAAVAGLILYKISKHKAPTALPTQKTGMLSMLTAMPITKLSGIAKELGVSEDLGSLGGGW
jgi:ABC-type enterochelin transport system permease subunit